MRDYFLRIFSFKRLAEGFEGQAHAEGEGVLKDCLFVVHDDFVHTSVTLLKDLQLRVGQLCGEGVVVPRDKSLQLLNRGCLRSAIGVGFDTGAEVDERKHVGLRNIRERLKVMVNGTQEIESTPGVGTKVFVKIPKETSK